jgi:radical SAM protein with 4Fe4S-binding SPASM domain
MKQYNKVFARNDFTDRDVVEPLCQNGFLVEDNDKENLILERILKADFEKSSQIQVVKIFSTNKCNAKCYYCFEKGIKPLDMTEQTASKTISFIKEFYPEKKLRIMWFGGEPLLNFNVIKQITLGLKEDNYDLTTHVTTNGSLLTKEMVNFFRTNYSNVSFQITIDDINERYYEIKRFEELTVDGAFSIVINNCKMLLDNDIFLSIRINFQEHQIDNAIKVFAHIKDIFANYEASRMRIYLMPLSLSEDCDVCVDSKENSDVWGKTPDYNSDEHPFLKLAKFNCEQGIVNDARAKNNIKKFLLSSFMLMPRGIPCSAVSVKHIVIDAAGNLYKCHRFAAHDEYIIGNVYVGIDKTNVHYQSFMNLSATESDCEVCNILPICQGGCRALRIMHGYNLDCKTKDIQSDLVKLYYSKLLQQSK